MIKKIIGTLWNYFTKMNTGTNGGISINRNMAWGIASLLIFVESYSLLCLPRATDTQIGMYNKLSITYVIVNACFVLLVLQITSVEKLNELAKTIKGNFFKKDEPEIPEKKIEDKTSQVIVNTQTEVITQQNENV